jgi:hypothetical protein
MTVGDLLSRMGSSELTEWMAYLSLRNDDGKQVETDKNGAKDAMTALFAHKIKRKANDGTVGDTRKP